MGKKWNAGISAPRVANLPTCIVTAALIAMDAGWEIIAYQPRTPGMTAQHFAQLLAIGKLTCGVTMERTKTDVGWEITACPKVKMAKESVLPLVELTRRIRRIRRTRRTRRIKRIRKIRRTRRTRRIRRIRR